MRSASPCSHPFDALTATIQGLSCSRCRTQLRGGLADIILLWGFQNVIDRLEGRLANAERALLLLGLIPCERCRDWIKPDGPFTFHVKSRSFHLCSHCVARSLGDPHDVVLWDPAFHGFSPEMIDDLVRWALTLPEDDSTRCSIYAHFGSRFRELAVTRAPHPAPPAEPVLSC